MRNVCGGAGRGVLYLRPGNRRKQADTTAHKQGKCQKLQEEEGRRAAARECKEMAVCTAGGRKGPSDQAAAGADLVDQRCIQPCHGCAGRHALQDLRRAIW